METGDRSPVGVPDNVEVAEEASWVVTPTQRFESAPHPTMRSWEYTQAANLRSTVRVRPASPTLCCAVAQRSEHPSDTREAGGSIPLSATTLRLLVQSRRCRRQVPGAIPGRSSTPDKH